MEGALSQGPGPAHEADSSGSASLGIILGDSVGQFRIVEEIGRGGIGVVYRAQNVATSEEVALKTLLAARPAELEALRREMSELGRVRHPGVVRVLAQGVHHGIPWYAMELVRGPTLEDQLAARSGVSRDTWKGDPALRTIQRLCDPLAFLHGEGIVHRDVKPANVVLRSDGQPVILDFGFVGRFGGAASRERLEAGGMILGSVAYMSPEQIRGEYVDARADLYSLGCMLYEAVTGRPPFLGTFMDVLRQHLDVTPNPPSLLEPTTPTDLEALILQLLAKAPRLRPGFAGDVGAALAAVLQVSEAYAVVPRLYLYRPSLQGRERPLAKVKEFLSRIKQAPGMCFLVGGESGSGKTRFAMEVTREAARYGCLVTIGECLPLEGVSDMAGMRGVPLHPMRPLLRSIADHCRLQGPEVTSRVLGRRVDALAAHEPAFADLPGVPRRLDATALPVEAARERLFADLAESIISFSLETPLVLVLDDLQWADDLTLGFLCSLGDSFFARARILILGTYRTEEVRGGLLDLTERSEVVGLTLSRLDEGKVASMIADMLAIEPAPPSLCRILARQSEGNPFFVSEYLRSAVETHLLGRANGRWALTISNAERLSNLESLPLPRTLHELVSQRLERIQGRTRTVLEAAAVVGREFEPELAGDVAGVTELERMAALADLVGQVVLEETASDRFRFVHDKLREAAYTAISPDRLDLLHRRAACAIEVAYRDAPGFAEFYPMLAHHWLMAGGQEQAREYLDKAGEQALAKGAHVDARDLLGRALTVDERLDPGSRASPDQQARRQRMLGEACFGSGDLAGSVAHSSTALVALQEPVPVSRAGWISLVAVELVRQAAHRLVPQRFVARQSVGARTAEVARASGQLATSLYYQGQPLSSLANILRSANRLESSGDTAEQGLAYARLGCVMGGAGLHRLADFYFRRARSFGKETRNHHGLGIGLCLESVYRLDQTRWRECESSGRESIELLEAIGDLQEGEFARTMLGHALYHQGRIQDGDEQFRSVLVSARARSNPHHVAWGLFLQARSKLALGLAEDALAMLEEAHSLLVPIFSRDHTAVMCEGPRALAYLAVGNASRAREVTAALWQALHDRPPPPVGAVVDAYEGAASASLRLWHLEGASQRSHAASMARSACLQLRRFARRLPLARPAASRCTAWLCWLSGQESMALRTWEYAANEARRRGMPYEQALAHEHLALHARTDAERERHRGEVRRLFSQLGRPERSVTRWAHEQGELSSSHSTIPGAEPLH